MFHTYVLAASGTVVDFDRASFLMDRELLQQSLDAMRDERDKRPRSDVTYDAQWVWDDYCQRHRERYGEGFVCDATPGWDQQPEQARGSWSDAEKVESHPGDRAAHGGAGCDGMSEDPSLASPRSDARISEGSRFEASTTADLRRIPSPDSSHIAARTESFQAEHAPSSAEADASMDCQRLYWLPFEQNRLRFPYQGPPKPLAVVPVRPSEYSRLARDQADGTPARRDTD